MMSANALFLGISHFRRLYRRVTGVWYPKEALVHLILAGHEAQLAVMGGYECALDAVDAPVSPYIMTRRQQKRDDCLAEQEWKRVQRMIADELKAFREVLPCKCVCERAIAGRRFVPLTCPFRL